MREDEISTAVGRGLRIWVMDIEIKAVGELKTLRLLALNFLQILVF